MADKKISELAELTSLAAGDYFPVVDISESADTDKNKRITTLNLAKGAQDQTSGAAFPAQPAYGSNRPFYRTDLGWWCYYDGTRWLTTQEFSVFVTGTLSATGSVGNLYKIREDYVPYFTRFSVVTKVATTNDGTNNWTVSFRGINLAVSAATTLHSFSTSGDAADTQVDHSGNCNGTPSPSNKVLTDVNCAKNNAPGNLLVQAGWFYRLIVT